MEEDHNVVRKSCNQVASPPFTFDKSCPPIMKPGTNLSKYTCIMVNLFGYKSCSSCCFIGRGDIRFVIIFMIISLAVWFVC